jgi:tol-pal system protein YbgF
MKSILIAVVIAAGCACAVPAHAALFGEDIDVTARKQIAEQQRRFDSLSAQHGEVAARLGKLEEAVKQQAQNQPVLELANQMQVMREELRSMRGQLEVLSNNVEANAKRQRDMYVDLDTRLRRFEQNAPAGPAAGPGAPPPGPGAAAAPPPGSSASTAAPAAPAPVAGAAAADEQRVYEAAQQQRRMGNYQAAIGAFQGFVQQFARSPLAHRAQYWIGDSYYNLRDFKNAIASQQKLLAAYPDSASVPDALLNMASSYIELGDNAAAKKTMDNLVARYPASEAAEKAKRRLTALR